MASTPPALLSDGGDNLVTPVYYSPRVLLQFKPHPVDQKAVPRAGCIYDKGGILVPDQNPHSEERPNAPGASESPQALPPASDRSEELLRLMIDGVQDFAIFALDTEGRLLSWNPGVGYLLGYEETEWVGLHGSIIFTPEDRERGAEALEREMAEREGRALDERWHVRRDGTRFYASGLLMALRDGEGRLRGFSKMLRDATDSRRSEEALCEAVAASERERAQFEAVLHSVSDGVVVCDMAGNFLFVNEAEARINGYASAEEMKRDLAYFAEVYELSHPDGRPLPVEEWPISSVLRGESVSNLELRGRRRDTGREWFFSFSGEPVHSEGGDQIMAVIVTRDITARKRAEAELDESREQLETVFNNATVSLFVMDERQHCTYMNPAAEELTGFKLAGVQGRPLHYFVHHTRPDGTPYPLEECPIDRAFPQNNQEQGEDVFVHSDGHFYPVAFTASPVRTGGRTVGTIIEVRGIAEEKRRQEERERLHGQLEWERSRLADLFTRAPAFIATVRGPAHVFEMVNPAYLQLVGHRDVIGKPVREALPELEGQGFFQLLDGVLRTGEPYVGREMTIHVEREPGAAPEERFVDFVYQPIFEADGTVSGIFGHGVDITEQVSARKQTEEASRLKDEFLATVSHELRTPLTAVLGWSHLLRSGQLKGGDAERALETIERNARAQAQLIEDLLDVSRIVTGNLRLDVRPVEPASFIDPAVEALRPAAEAKGVRLQKVIDTGLSTVAGDPARLQQVVWNLLSNAVKFTPKGGRVQVRLERVDSHVEIAVSDTGAGIDPEFLPHVFERFRQADQKTTRAHGGLGLGLAIVRHLVELHGGTIDAESGGEGHGATFTVRLPVAPLHQREEEGERVHPAARNTLPPYECPERLDGLRVLVVDDEPDARELLKVGLGQCGAQVTAASSAREALEALARVSPDVLISDIGMPGEDGYELIRRVRALPAGEGGEVPAVALTAYARIEDRMRALRAGYQMHVAKPVELAELVAVMLSLLRRGGPGSGT